MVRDGLVGCHGALVEQAGGWLPRQSLHILDKTGQLGQLLRDLRLGDKCALAPPDIDKAALDQILNRLPHGRAADLEPLDQALFRRQLGLRGQATVSDIARQDRLDTFAEIPASEVSRPPLNPTCTGFPATVPNPGKIPDFSSMAGANSVASV